MGGTGNPNVAGETKQGSEMLSAPITMTDAAVTRARALMGKSDKPVQGLRVGVRARGCTGLSYFCEYADEPKPFEDVVEVEGVKIFIDPSSVMFLLGSEMDYVEEELESKFVFRNPNEKGRCGCGESFHV